MANLFWPFDLSTVSEWCGTYRGNGVYHMGVDFAVSQGTELRATASGRIVRWSTTSGGNGLDIIRDDGLLVRNWHLSRMDVSTSDHVEAGQIIGLTGGAPGTWGAGNSTGPHLHWELRTDSSFTSSNWIDPNTLSPATFGESEHEKEDMSKSLYYNAASDSPSGVVKTGDWWVRTLPGEPLRRVTHGQASDYFALEGLDFNSPNVTSKDGSWFDLAFAEDNKAHANTVQSHPYMDVISGLSSLNVNVDALAQAIADKINGGITGPDITTKAEILSAIEANYPEGV